MATRDLHNNIEPSVALNTTAISSDTTTNGTNIVDTAGFESVEFLIQSGTLTDGTYTPSITEGDASDLSGGNAVAASDLIGTIAGATFAATDDNKVKRLGYKGSKRYVRLNITSASTSTGGTIGAIAVLGHPHDAPTA
jgi:hypothetical protein